MDKSHRYRKPHKSAGHKSVDGFISADRFKHPTGSIGFRDKKQTTTVAEETKKIDDFSRPSGYHPSNTDLSGNVGASQPLLPDGPRQPLDARKLKGLNKPPKRRRFFHRPKSWKKFFIKSGLTTLVILLIVGGYLGYKLYITQKHILKGGGSAPAVAACSGDIPVSSLKTEGDSRINILLLGIGGPGHDGPNLTDTILIASIDPINHKADLISIPRDLWVSIPKLGYQKINAAYETGLTDPTLNSPKSTDIKNGLKEADQVISGVIGIKIHYNIVVNFKAFRDAVNAVGGITVNVPETLYDPTIAWENGWNPVIAKKGIVSMKGAQALLYVRSRETSTDFARGQRQRAVIVALKDKVLTLGTFSNPLKISSLLDSLGNNVYSDFDLATIKCLYKQGSAIPSSSIQSLDMVTPPHDLLTTGPINGLSTVFPKAGLFNYTDIQTFVRSTLKDSFIAKENANITILNGTNLAGLATKEADLLKSYGYRVGKVTDAPSKNYQKTVLVNLKGGTDKYTEHYLENRLGVKSTGSLPDKSISPDSADFVIILGTDAFNNF